MSDEAIARKARSEAILYDRGIPFITSLPAIETADEIRLRSGEAVMQRAMCLFAVSNAAIRGEASAANELLGRWGLADALSPDEQEFMRSARMPQQKVQFSWRCEALVPLSWATGLYDSMEFPSDTYDFGPMAEFWSTVPARYWEDVGTRSAGEILDEADLIYRLHWAVRDAGLNGKPAPGELNAGVVQERHHALNWLIGYDGAEWDDVGTDT